MGGAPWGKDTARRLHVGIHSFLQAARMICYRDKLARASLKSARDSVDLSFSIASCWQQELALPRQAGVPIDARLERIAVEAANTSKETRANKSHGRRRLGELRRDGRIDGRRRGEAAAAAAHRIYQAITSGAQGHVGLIGDQRGPGGGRRARLRGLRRRRLLADGLGQVACLPGARTFA